MKRCRTCSKKKPLDEFYRHMGMADGHLNNCKDCVKKRIRIYRLTHESVQEYERSRAKTQKRKELSARRLKKYRMENEAAYRAQTALNNAVRDRRIIKEPCAICGTTEHINGHHRDYAEPLKVIWLCARCHHRLHANGIAYS